MGKYFLPIIWIIVCWISGYFSPEKKSKTPFKILNTYTILPKWLNGILREKHSSQIPDRVISTRGLGAQLAAYIIAIVIFGLNQFFNFMDETIFIVYGCVICSLVGLAISVVITRYRPYLIDEIQTTKND